MEKWQKRILAINDISCFGKCSLTVALPILSAAGFEVCPMPTALLSTHTGGFEGYTFKNLDDQMMPIATHWEKMGLEFDAIYSGYLGSFEQIEYVKNIIDNFKTDNMTVLIDPVMGDNGVLYKGFTYDFSAGMAELCKKADIIVPNITEASYLISEEYKSTYDGEDIEKILRTFHSMGIKKIVITGIPMENNVVACGICDEGEISFVRNKRIEGMYHGTGDVFASALLSAVLSGDKLKKAAEVAAKFVYDCISLTFRRYGVSHYGVDFESLLNNFTKM